MKQGIIRQAMLWLLFFASSMAYAQNDDGALGDNDMSSPSISGGTEGLKDSAQGSPNIAGSSGGLSDETQSSSGTGEVVKGDVNNDGAVTLADAKVITDFYLGKVKTINTQAADMNGDGKITMADANAIVNVVRQ